MTFPLCSDSKIMTKRIFPPLSLPSYHHPLHFALHGYSHLHGVLFIFQVCSCSYCPQDAKLLATLTLHIGPIIAGHSWTHVCILLSKTLCHIFLLVIHWLARLFPSLFPPVANFSRQNTPVTLLFRFVDIGRHPDLVPHFVAIYSYHSLINYITSRCKEPCQKMTTTYHMIGKHPRLHHSSSILE